MNIVILGGGNSAERDVSLRSAKAVKDALSTSGHHVTLIDPSEDAEFYTHLPQGAVVLPMLHGAGGEDGTLQRVLEAHAIPFLGSDSESSALSFDKSAARKVLQTFNIAVAEGYLVSQQEYIVHPLASQPHVIKTCRGGSSIGTYVVRDPAFVDMGRVNEIFNLDSTALLEELVEGIEITVGVLDAAPLPIVEIIVPNDQEFDYQNKYSGNVAELCPPRNVAEPVQKTAQELAVTTHTALGARHLSRTDMIIRSDGGIVVLELNSLPGMTAQSLFPLAAAQAGYSMPDLVSAFVAMVVRDYKLNEDA